MMRYSCLCYSPAGWLVVYLCERFSWGDCHRSTAVLLWGTAHLEQNRCSFELEQSLSCEAQLDASWLLAGQMSSQSQMYWEVQHSDTQMSLNKLNLAPTWSLSQSSGLALVDLSTEHSTVTALKLRGGQNQSGGGSRTLWGKGDDILFFLYFAF